MSEYNYDNLPEVQGEIINWDEVGQEIRGTYVGISDPIDTKYGQNFLYEIMEDDGNIKKCWGRKNINDVMKFFDFGTRVKIKFVESLPSKKGSNFKDIKVFGNSKVVNEEWLKQRTGKTTSASDESISAEEAKEIINGPQKEVEAIEVGAKDEEPFLVESEKKRLIVQITEMATKKLGATNGEDVKNKVMEATELAFIDNNLAKIARALAALPDRK